MNGAPITPQGVAIAAHGQLSTFVFNVINQLLVESKESNYIDDMKLIIPQAKLRQRLEEEARARGIMLEDEMWKSFPYFYAEAWDIETPIYASGYDPCYVFRPKGLRRMKRS